MATYPHFFIVSGSLLIGSIITLINSSLVLSSKKTQTTVDYNESEYITYVILGVLGIIIGILGFIYQKILQRSPYLLTIITYIWLGVSLACSIRTSRYYTNNSIVTNFNPTGFVIELIIIGVLIIISTLFSYVYQK